MKFIASKNNLIFRIHIKCFISILILLSGFSSAQVNDSTKLLQQDKKIPASTDTTKTSLADTLKHTVVIDTLIPIHQKMINENSFVIPRNVINKLDYRYAGDLLKPFDFYFTKDQGFVGQPNETSIYGTGFNGISFLEDGILFNNRLTNSLDLNLIQTEYIDSIEIVPLPRGFLYSPYNNNVSINFITRDFLSRPPFSRVKYYQGPNGEALVDVLFNSWLYKRFNASFDITNRKTDDSYLNSNFSLWQARLKLKYILSDKINIIANYYFVTSQTGLNGGVDYSQIESTTKDINSALYGNDINSILYNAQLAPVIDSTRYEQTKQQNFSLRFLGRFSEFSNTDLTIYYRSNFDEISSGPDSAYFVNTDRNKIFGASLRQDFTGNLFNLSFIGNYEKYDLNYDALYQSLHPVVNYNSSNYSLSSIISFATGDKTFVPSIFFKASHNPFLTYNPNSAGYGADLKVNFHPNLFFYAGYSFYNDTDIKNFEVSADYKSENLAVGFKYFSKRDFYRNVFPIPDPSDTLPHTNLNSQYPAPFGYVIFSEEDMNGLGAHLNFDIWKIAIENSAAYYFNPNNSETLLSSVPKYTYRGGIYYKNILFNGNLDLKTGLVFYYNGERSSKINNLILPVVSANNHIDFTLAGEIQKAAIVYFTWENLLNKQYFIVPFYPMPGRNIRFGIAWELFN